MVGVVRVMGMVGGLEALVEEGLEVEEVAMGGWEALVAGWGWAAGVEVVSMHIEERYSGKQWLDPVCPDQLSCILHNQGWQNTNPQRMR